MTNALLVYSAKAPKTTSIMSHLETLLYAKSEQDIWERAWALYRAIPEENRETPFTAPVNDTPNITQNYFTIIRNANQMRVIAFLVRQSSVVDIRLSMDIIMNKEGTEQYGKQ